MDDKFLYENRPPVRLTFRKSLYARLSTGANAKKATRFWLQVLKLGVVGLLVFGLVMVISGPVQAGVLNWIRQVAGLGIKEVNSLPTAESTFSVPPQKNGSLESIRQDLPFEFELPAYVPEGFTFDDNVQIQPESVFMRWIKENGDQVLLQVETDHDQLYLTGTNAAQEIQINDQPAMLFQGGYDANYTWDPNLKMTNVLQRREKLIYWLIYIQGSVDATDMATIKDELLHMFSSIPRP